MDSNDMGGVGAQQANLLGQVQTSLLRKAMDQEKEATKTLIESMLPKAPNPPHLGNNVDRYV
ncbi:MAG: YjfB family protein [Bacillota bacterium]